MKKSTFILIFTFLSINLYSQISFGPKSRGKQEKFEKGLLEKVKNSKTIFVLPSIYEINEYEEILKNNWKLENFEIIIDSEIETLELVEKSNENISLFRFVGYVSVVNSVGDSVSKTSLFTHFSMAYYDVINLKKETASINRKENPKKYNKKLYANSFNVAKILLFPNDILAHKLISTKRSKKFHGMEKDKFYNFNLGFFKNYIQELSTLLENENEAWLYENKKYTPELKELTDKTLYIPSYLKIKYNGWKKSDSEPDSSNIETIFSNYGYKYEIIDDKVLNDKILNGEELYYLRYVRRNTERFLNIVNSKTGKPIYKDYIAGMAYNLKKDNFKDLSKCIKKASK